MPTQPPTKEFDAEKLRRSYRFMFSASVCLAAIGAPLLMQGVVALVDSVSGSQRATLSSVVQGVAVFVLSSVPMLLAWVAWKRTQQFQEHLERRR